MSITVDPKTFNVKNGNYIGKMQYYSTILNPNRTRFVSGVYSMLNHNTAIYTGKWPVNALSLNTYYDFGEVDSYSGTGSSMTDLSTNNQNISATGGSYSTDNGGYWTISGNQYLALTSSYGFSTGALTLEAWVYPTSYPSTASGMIFGTGGSNFAGVLYFGYLNTGGYYFGGWDGSTRWGTSISVPSPLLGNWAYVAFGRSGNAWRAYTAVTRSGNTTISTASLNFSATIGQSGPRFGSNASNSSECFNGRIGMFRSYTRYLSDDELFNNFNCQRNRFSI